MELRDGSSEYHTKYPFSVIGLRKRAVPADIGAPCRCVIWDSWVVPGNDICVFR